MAQTLDQEIEESSEEEEYTAEDAVITIQKKSGCCVNHEQKQDTVGISFKTIFSLMYYKAKEFIVQTNKPYWLFFVSKFI